MKYLIFFSFVFITIEFVTNYFLIQDQVLVASYQGKFSNTQIESILDFRREWLWITYPIKLFIQIIYIFIIASILYMGLYLSGFDVNFQQIFKISILSQFVFFIPVFIKIGWFSFNQINFEAIGVFEPFSIFSLFDPNLLQDWLYYPFKVLNLFEVGYWILLAYLLAKHLNQAFDAMLKLVLTYYVSFLFCWVAFVMFISIGNG